MKLLITRHGESEENSQKIILGRLPGKLNDIGLTQSQKLGQRLSSEKIDFVYCSPANRCVETLNEIKHYQNSNPMTIFSDLLLERDFGKLSGKPISEINFDLIDQDSPENQSQGIESLNDLNKRIKKFMNDLKQNNSLQENILIITSSNPIKMILAELLGKSYFEILTQYKINNASLTTIEINNQEPLPLTINETDFLK